MPPKKVKKKPITKFFTKKNKDAMPPKKVKAPNPWNVFRKAHSDLHLDMKALSKMYAESKLKKAPGTPVKVARPPVEAARPPVEAPRVAPVLTEKLSPATLQKLASSQWSKSARAIESSTDDVCSMDQSLFFNFIRWFDNPTDIQPDYNELYDDVEWAKQQVASAKEDKKKDAELFLKQAEKKVKEFERKEAEMRKSFIGLDKKKALEPEWFCKFVTDKMKLKTPVRALLGVGLNSFVAIVMDKGEKRALRATHADTEVSADERRIQEILGKEGLSPKILAREEHGRFRFEIMELIVTTFEGLLQSTKLNGEIAKEVAQAILYIVGELKRLKIVHGDLHRFNLGLTAAGKILIYDFDLSSEKYDFPGFDLAIFYSQLVPSWYKMNEGFVRAVRKELRPHVDPMWFDKEGKFNEEFLSSVRYNWANFLRTSRSKYKIALERLIGPLRTYR